MAVVDSGGSTAGKANVLATFELATAPSLNGSGVRMFSEVDAGDISGTPHLLSPETDDDYRLRVSQDFMYDTETFNYTAQNTAKHLYLNTTMANAWNAAGMTTNSGNISTNTTGTNFGTWALFPVFGAASLYCEVEGGFTAQPTSNSVIDFGMFARAAANPWAPTDGAYFRLNASGLFGVINSNGTETPVNFYAPFVYVNSQKYQFIITISEREVEFWIDGTRYGNIATPAGQGQPFMSGSLPFSVRHAITGGAAGAALSFTLNDYTITQGGMGCLTSTASSLGNRMHGSYQGLSGGTIGSLSLTGTITTGNSANPTPAVPTTTTAALGTGLGGRFWETATLAVNTDGIVMSFQVPTGTVNLSGRRLVLRGLYLSSYVQTVLVGGPLTVEWFLAFGHTTVSLNNAYAGGASATKAPVRIVLPFTQQITAAQAVNTAIAQQVTFLDLGDAPVFVNPGEFVQVCKRHVGTVLTAGTIVSQITPVYGWE